MRKGKTIYNLNNISSELRKTIEGMILADAKDGRIKCGKAKAIATTLSVSAKSVGFIADQLQITISKCQLGCF